MNTNLQIGSAWCGILCMVCMFAGLWPAAEFFPPPAATLDADAVVALYRANTAGIRLGVILVLLAGALSAPLVAVISAQIRRIEHDRVPVMTYLQLSTGTAGILLFVLAGIFWSAAAFRVDRLPDVTQALNDVSWLLFVTAPFLGVLQNFSIGFAILADMRAKPVFPRWLGYFNFWSGLMYVPGCLATYFKAGPFAWDGLIAFWLAAVFFGLWFFVMAIYVIKAAKAEALAPRAR